MLDDTVLQAAAIKACTHGQLAICARLSSSWEEEIAIQDEACDTSASCYYHHLHSGECVCEGLEARTGRVRHTDFPALLRAALLRMLASSAQKAPQLPHLSTAAPEV